MKQVALFGIGISGLSTIDYLARNNYEVIAIDDSEERLDLLKNKYTHDQKTLDRITTYHDINKIDWKNIEFLILSPGVPLKYPKPHNIVLAAQKNNCKIIGDIELFYNFNKDKNFIGITGTNGKSTTTSLTGHIFSQNKVSSGFGGNIGIPCFDLKPHDNYIFEMSSYQLDLSNEAKFNIAALLNITPDHLDRHKDINGYIEAKKRIFLNQKKNDVALINIDDENCRKIYEELKNNPKTQSKVIAISTQSSTSDSISIINNKIINNISKKEIILGNLDNLKGNHNKQNIAFAYAISYFNKISDNKIIKSIKSFKGMDHRLKFVKKTDNISFINDSKATNVESTLCALEAYDNIFWIAGGELKANDLTPLKKYLKNINKAFLIGKDQEIFANFLNDNKIENYLCDNMDKAFLKAVKMAKEKGEEVNILLSPACASFDQWKNFEVRGNHFCQLVNKL